jgi:hypothetical protein
MERNRSNRRRKTLTTKVCLGGLAFFLISSAYSDNMRVGPFHFNLGLNPGFRYTDNANASETDPQGAFYLTVGPSLSGGTTLETLGGEQLTLSMSVNYEWCVSGNQTDTFSAPVNFALTIPIYLYRWSFVLADTFTFSNDPLEASFAFNTDRVPQFHNTASVNATRQFGKYALTLGAQMLNNWYPDTPQQEYTQYQFSMTPSYFLREGYSVFWQNVLGFTFQQSPKQNVLGLSTALGVSGQITPSLSGSVSLGYSWNFFQLRDLGPGGGIFGGIFDPVIVPSATLGGISSTVSLNYTHPLRPNTTYTLSFYTNPGMQALLQDSSVQSTYGVNFGLSHRLSRGITLSPRVSWQHIEDVGPQNPAFPGTQERADMLELSIGFSRQLTRKLGATIEYRFQQRSSNLVGQSYQVNEITGSLNYTF